MQQNRTKKELRTNILNIRNSLTENDISTNSKLITSKILRTQDFEQCRFLLGFASYQTEVAVYDLLNEALRLGKRVFLPRVLPITEQNEFGNAMEMIEIQSLNEIQPGFHGIPEPIGNVSFVETASGNVGAGDVLMIQPGVVFDTSFHRIGYGKGFYDVYLKRLEQHGIPVTKIAVCHDLQLLSESIPSQERDIRPDYIFTEKRRIKLNQYGE